MPRGRGGRATRLYLLLNYNTHPRFSLPRPAQRHSQFQQCANQAYEAGSYERAHELYSEAIGMVDGQDTDETKAHLFANRAAALMNLERNADAVRDCQQVRNLSLVRPSTSLTLRL